uniref:Uncharacterized protein n=1 Tax=Hyaloperonospora arabidopsidis (strain Emoy2) TaxID=559515 RepID=M4B7D9_HYAAE
MARSMIAPFDFLWLSKGTHSRMRHIFVTESERLFPAGRCTLHTCTTSSFSDRSAQFYGNPAGSR